MKSRKILSVLLAILLIGGIFSAQAFANDNSPLPLSAGIKALQGQFEKGVGPKTNGYTLDYRYYSPAEDGKYPLVVWLHGMSEGAHEGKQVTENDIAYWTSAEFQSRFTDAGGAHILVPRSLEEKLIFWDDSMIEPLKATIEDFIQKNSETVDTTRIYIGGFSMGGKMTLKMAIYYPDMFAAAFPICPAWAPDAQLAANLADMPLWLTSGTTDPLVNYQTSVIPTWNTIKEVSNQPENIRFSTLSKVCYPDGKRTSSAHHAWFAVTYDMFSIENGDYPYMTTVDGNDETVTLTYPDGMISWLSQFSSDYDGEAVDGDLDLPNGNFLGTIIEMMLSVFKAILSIFKIF